MSRSTVFRNVLTAALLTLAASAQAQGTGRSLDIDTSIRSSGMGGASEAVFWGGDPNEWANPALLGYHRGVRYTYGRTQLVPGLAANVHLTSKRFTYGVGGFTVLTAGLPSFAPGSVHLDYGASEGRDDQGNPTGTFASWEHIEAWGFGVSASELVKTFAALRGSSAPAFTRYVDVAGGIVQKDLDIVLGPAAFGGTASGTGYDWGFLARVTPVDLGEHAALPLRVDGAYGVSVLNFNDERFVFLNEDMASPLTRGHRHGVAGRVAIGIPAALRETLSPRAGWLWDSLDPLISIGGSDDHERNTAGDLDDGYRVHRSGYEIIFANIATLRHGHVTDRDGQIIGPTKGWGWGVQLGRFAGFRYDHATIPQARDSGLSDVTRRGYTAFIDLMALRRR